MWNADLGRERLSKSPMRPPRIDASWTKARSFRLSYRVAIRRLCLILLKRSTRLRGFIEVGTEAIGLLRLLFGEMPCSLVDDEFSDPVGVIAMIGKQHRSTSGETEVCRQADCRGPHRPSARAGQGGHWHQLYYFLTGDLSRFCVDCIFPDKISLKFLHPIDRRT